MQHTTLKVMKFNVRDKVSRIKNSTVHVQIEVHESEGKEIYDVVTLLTEDGAIILDMAMDTFDTLKQAQKRSEIVLNSLHKACEYTNAEVSGSIQIVHM